MVDYIPDHKQRIKDDSLSQFDDDPVFQALLTGYGEMWQTLEDAIFDGIVSGRLDVAADEWLEEWGQLVAEGRGGLGDKLYRRIIVGKVRANRSNGTHADLASLVEGLIDPVAYQIRPFNFYPEFRVELLVDDALPDDYSERVVGLLREGKSAGIGMSAVEADYDQGFQLDHTAPHSLDSGLFGRRIA